MRPHAIVRTALALLQGALLAACTSAATDEAPAAADAVPAAEVHRAATLGPGATMLHEAPHAVSDAGPHAHAAELPADAPLPGASLHHLEDVWTDHRGDGVRLADHRGHPTVVVLFYGTCISACPVLLRDAELIEAGLPDDLRATTHFLMVTFDPERDTPERLAGYAADKGLDRERWSFLTADDRAVRRLAAALGVRYRPDGQGGFAHTNLITVLDGDGVPVARLEGLGLGPDAAVAALAAVR